MKNKIEKLIREKRRELQKLKDFDKKKTEENSKKIDEDWKLKNMFNPFYKNKYNVNKDFTGILFIATQQARLKQEIKELNDLLKGK